MLKTLTATAANAPPTSGPRIGTHAYRQPHSPFPPIGSRKCATRGPRSRPGLIAYPVGPPTENPLPQPSPPTTIGTGPATPAHPTKAHAAVIHIPPAFSPNDPITSAPAQPPLPSTINPTAPPSPPTTGDRSTTTPTLPRTHSPPRQYGRTADPPPSTPH